MDLERRVDQRPSAAGERRTAVPGPTRSSRRDDARRTPRWFRVAMLDEAHAARAAQDGSHDERSGLVGLAGVLLGFAGIFGIVQGIVALTKADYLDSGARFGVGSLDAWGWIMLVVGGLQAFGSFAVLYPSRATRWGGVALAAVGGLAQLFFMRAYPFWSVSLLAIDLIVIYALTVHGGPEG